jgi:hypothetical protein
MSAINKAIIQGLTGALAPELVDWISANIKAKLGIKDKKSKGRGRKRSSGRKRSKPKNPDAAVPAPKPSRRKPR